MQNYFSNLEKPLTFWKSAPIDVSITLGESADDRGADFVGQADIGQIVKDLCQAADKYNRYIKVAAVDPAKNVGRASRALMIPVKMTPAEFEVEPPQRKEVKEKKSGPKLGGAIAGGVTGLVSGEFNFHRIRRLFSWCSWVDSPPARCLEERAKRETRRAPRRRSRRKRASRRKLSENRER